jgi:hypothetical protein
MEYPRLHMMEFYGLYMGFFGLHTYIHTYMYIYIYAHGL